MNKKFEEDKTIFSKSFYYGHTLKKLPNLNPDQVELDDDYINGSLLKILDSPEVYELNGVLSMSR